MPERAKYSADQMKSMMAKGQAMPNANGDPSFPIADKEDLANAIRAVGRAGKSGDAVRRFIMKRARALGASDMIPDTWNSDGSLKGRSTAPTNDLIREAPFELIRAEQSGDGLTMSGYAAVFNSPTVINSWEGHFRESIRPGAFKKTLSERTPVLMFDHGKHPLIGTMPLGTITRAREDDHGVHIEARLSNNWLIQPVRDAIADRAVTGMSFRFSVVRDEWTKPDASGIPDRFISELRSPEMGPVVFPAYTDTSVGVRSLELADLLRDPEVRSDLARALFASNATPPEAADGTSDGAGEHLEPQQHSGIDPIQRRDALAAIAALRGVIK